MIDVYLLQSIYDDYLQLDCIIFNVKDTDVWIDNEGQANFTPKFWKDVEKKQEVLLTYVGVL